MEGKDRSQTTKQLPHVMKSDVSPLSLNKQSSNVSDIGSQMSSAPSTKYSITQTPVNIDNKHPELINAPIKEDEKLHKKTDSIGIDRVPSTSSGIKRNHEKDKLNLKNQTSMNLHNYNISMKSLEDHIASISVGGGSISTVAGAGIQVISTNNSSINSNSSNKPISSTTSVANTILSHTNNISSYNNGVNSSTEAKGK